MDEKNTMFSADGQSYNKEEVDAYFLKMKEEFDKLSSENQKLYKDCVSFARRLKKVQESGALDTDIAALKNENAQYRKKILALQEELEQIKASADSKDAAESASASAPTAENDTEAKDGYFNRPSEKVAEPIQKTTGAVFFDDMDDEDPQDAPSSRNNREPKGKRPKKKKSHSFLRAILIILLILGILLGAVSVAAGVIGHSSDKNKNLFGYRAYVVNNDLSGVAEKDDVILVEVDTFDEISSQFVILATPENRSLAIVDRVVENGNQKTLRVFNENNDDYTVTADTYLGEAKYVIDGNGLIRWAIQNPITYFLILAIILLILILLLALIPSRRKVRKINRANGIQ